jgi:hypothetical protein
MEVFFKVLSIEIVAGSLRLMPIILATYEAEIRRISV